MFSLHAYGTKSYQTVSVALNWEEPLLSLFIDGSFTLGWSLKFLGLEAQIPLMGL